MVSIDYIDGKVLAQRAGHAARPHRAFDPSAIVLHYAQEVFEGLKAYRWADWPIVSFRAEANAARLRSSARRLAIPELPEVVFIESLRQLIGVDDHRCRPLAVRSRCTCGPTSSPPSRVLRVRPASEYRYLVIGSTRRGRTSRAASKPVSVWLSTEYVRACPAAPGRPEFGGNYAASLVAQAQASDNGCDQVVWLDAIERALRRRDGRHEPVLCVRQRWFCPLRSLLS